MSTIKDEFSTALSWLIEKKNINQAALARSCGISPPSLSDYKTGRREGRESLRKKISEALNIDYRDALKIGRCILDGEDPEKVFGEAKQSKEKTASTPFSEAMNYFLKQKGWGGDSVFAKKIGLSQGYVSELSRGIKDGHEKTRREIAKSFGLNYEQFLDLGRLITDGIPGDVALDTVQRIATGSKPLVDIIKTEERTNDALRVAFNYLRKSRKIKLKDLAAVGSCTTRHLSAVLSEKDRRGMSRDLADAIAAYFSLSYDQFLTLGLLILDGNPSNEAMKRTQLLATGGRIRTKEIGEEIRKARESAGMTQESVAALFKQLTRQSVYNWENGTSFPTRDKWPVLEEAFGKPAGWLLALQSEGKYPPFTDQAADLHRLPVISFVQAGEWTGTYDDILPDEGEWTNYPGPLGSRAFALRVSGPSMEPEFIEGDIIIVDPDLQIESGDYVIAKNCEEEATFKRYYRDGDRHFLVPENPDWGKPMEMTGRDWRIIGKVVGKIKKY